MRRTIFLKMFLGYLSVMVVMAVLILAFTYGIVRSHYLDTTEDNLKSIGIPLQQLMIPPLKQNNTGLLNDLAKQYGRELDLRVTVIDNAGKVLADSEKDPSTLESHRDRPEVKQALAGTVGRSVRYSTTLWQDLLYTAIPLRSGGKIIGVLRLSTPLTHISDLLKALRGQELQLTILVMLISLAIAALISHLLSTPIRALSKAAKNVASGDFTVRVPPGPTMR
jgi:two-component system phosphate regulon sensor histidine kinase PhoR